MSAIQSDYRTFKHIPSLKCYQLIMEIPEEEFANVCNVLGYPKTGENTYVGIALLNKAVVKESLTTEQSEGERLRTRAVLLCDDNQFQQFTKTVKWGAYDGTSLFAAYCIRDYCGIKSRSELAHDENAQCAFRELLHDFDAWKTSQQYADNLSRT